MNIKQLLASGQAKLPLINKDGVFATHDGKVVLANVGVAHRAKFNQLSDAVISEYFQDNTMAFSQFPTETWIQVSETISSVDTSEDSMLFMAMQSAGIATPDATWDIGQFEVPIRGELTKTVNGEYADVTMDGQNLTTALTTNYSNNVTKNPIISRNIWIGGRLSSVAKDNDTARSGAEVVVKQRESLITRGLTNFYRGITNSDYSYITNNTLIDSVTGVPYFGAGINFSDPDQAVKAIKWGAGQLRKQGKRGGIIVVLGIDLYEELDTEPTGLTTGLTLRERIMKLTGITGIVQDLELDSKTAVLVPTNPKYVNFRNSGGLQVVELTANIYGATAVVYTLGGLVITPDGVNQYNIIVINSLLP